MGGKQEHMTISNLQALCPDALGGLMDGTDSKFGLDHWGRVNLVTLSWQRGQSPAPARPLISFRSSVSVAQRPRCEMLSTQSPHADQTEQDLLDSPIRDQARFRVYVARVLISSTFHNSVPPRGPRSSATDSRQPIKVFALSVTDCFAR